MPQERVDADDGGPSDELMDYLVTFLDFGALAKLSVLSTDYRYSVRQFLFERVCEVLAPFLRPDDVLPFFDMLHSINGLIFGDVAQRVCCPGGGAAMWCDQRTRIYCLNGEDLNIVVPGPDGLEEAVRWFVSRGYGSWKGMNLQSHTSELGSETDFVVGSKWRSHWSSVQERAVTIAWGPLGCYLSTIPSPLGDSVAFISASRVHRVDAKHLFQPSFDRSWALASIPWSPRYDDRTPDHLIETTCASVARNIKYRQCRNFWCRDSSRVFDALKRVSGVHRL